MELKNKKGAVTLSVILLLAGITMELVIAGVIITMLINNTLLSSKLASEALAVAMAGVQDAELRIARDKNFSSPGYKVPSNCSLNGSSPCADVIVERCVSGTCSPATCSQPIIAGQDCIVSLGTAFTRNKKVEAVLSVDASGKINTLSLEEIPL